MKKGIHTTVKNFKDYLDEIERLSKRCSPEQKAQLNNILKTQLTLLVCLKKASNLGEVVINFLGYPMD